MSTREIAYDNAMLAGRPEGVIDCGGKIPFSVCLRRGGLATLVLIVHEGDFAVRGEVLAVQVYGCAHDERTLLGNCQCWHVRSMGIAWSVRLRAIGCLSGCLWLAGGNP